MIHVLQYLVECYDVSQTRSKSRRVVGRCCVVSSSRADYPTNRTNRVQTIMMKLTMYLLDKKL